MNKKIKEKERVVCPDCREEIRAGKGKWVVGEIYECANCACEVEIISANPLKYQALFEEK